MASRRSALPAFLGQCLIPLLLGAGCGGSAETPSSDPPTTGGAVSKAPETSTSLASTTEFPSTSVGITLEPPATVPAPTFISSAETIPPEVKGRMDGHSMRPGCPVGFDDLRYLRLTYWSFDGVATIGEMVVHVDVVDQVTTAFLALFDARFPIRKMTLVDDYGAEPDPMDGASDFRSIEDDNTSAFNCRRTTGSESQYSEHSYGRAIDLNPIENPYVSAGGTSSHPASAPFLDRSLDAPGVITDNGVVVAAFESVGWGWGGRWTTIKDYQHFSATGR